MNVVYIAKKDIRKDIYSKYGILEKDIVISEFGKPMVKDKNLYFNISHSKDYFTMIVGECNVGIDIEVKKDIDYINISKRIFNPKDIEKIKSIDDFYRMWVRNEAYTKYLGFSIFNKKKEEVSKSIINEVKITDIKIGSDTYLSYAYDKNSEVEIIFWK